MNSFALLAHLAVITAMTARHARKIALTENEIEKINHAEKAVASNL